MRVLYPRPDVACRDAGGERGGGQAVARAADVLADALQDDDAQRQEWRSGSRGRLLQAQQPRACLSRRRAAGRGSRHPLGARPHTKSPHARGGRAGGAERAAARRRARDGRGRALRHRAAASARPRGGAQGAGALLAPPRRRRRPRRHLRRSHRLAFPQRFLSCLLRRA